MLIGNGHAQVNGAVVTVSLHFDDRRSVAGRIVVVSSQIREVRVAKASLARRRRPLSGAASAQAKCRRPLGM